MANRPPASDYPFDPRADEVSEGASTPDSPPATRMGQEGVERSRQGRPQRALVRVSAAEFQQTQLSVADEGGESDKESSAGRERPRPAGSDVGGAREDAQDARRESSSRSAYRRVSSGGGSRRRRRRRRNPQAEHDSGRLMFVGACVLVGVVALSPWFLGCVSPLAVFSLVICFAALVGIWWSCVAIKGGQALRLPWNTLPLGLLALLAVIQLVPLPGSWLERLAPVQQEWRRQVAWMPAGAGVTAETRAEGDSGDNSASVLSEPVHETSDGHPLSLNPTGTRHDLTVLLLGISAFACAAVFLRRRRAFHAMLIALTINGFLLAVFGMLQRFTWNGYHFWFLDNAGRLPFASFVNPNNAGGYLNLCLACALGVLFIAFMKGSSRRRRSSAGWNEWEAFPDVDTWASQAIARVGRFVAELTAWKLTTITLAATIMAGLLLSYSRGAILAACCSLIITSLLLMLSPRHRWFGLGFAFVFLVATLATAFLGEAESVRQEVATVVEESYENDQRLVLLEDLLPHSSNHLLIGSGFGSFREVYRIYRGNTHDTWFYHAENDYLEIFFDGGIVALLLVLLLLFWGLWQAAYLIRFGDSTAEVGLGLVFAFALSSQGIQAAFDFGLYLPANLILLATLAGAAAAASHRLFDGRLAASRRERAKLRESAGLPVEAALRRRPVRRTVPAVIAWVIPIALFAGLIALAGPAQRQVELRLAEQAANEMSLTLRDSQPLEDETLARTATRLEQAAMAARDGDGFRRLGELYLAAYRHAWSKQIREDLEAQGRGVSWEEVHAATTLPALHGQVQQLAQERGERAVQRQREERLSQKYLQPALDAFLQARKFAPFTATNYLRIAQLAFLVDVPEANQAWIERAVWLAPGRCDVLYEAGLTEAQTGRSEQAKTLWSRCLDNSSEYQIAILRMAVGLFSMEQIETTLLPQDPDGITWLRSRLQKAERGKRPLVAPPGWQASLDEYTALVYRRAWIDNRESLSPAAYLEWFEIRADELLTESTAVGDREEEVSPSNPKPVPSISQLAASRFAELEELLLTAVEQHPEATSLNYRLAELYFDRGRYEEARERIEACLQRQPRREKFQRLERKIRLRLRSGSLSLGVSAARFPLAGGFLDLEGNFFYTDTGDRFPPQVRTARPTLASTCSLSSAPPRLVTPNRTPLFPA